MGECPYYRSKASADCWPDPDDGDPADCWHGRADYDTCPIAWAMRESGRADAAEKRVAGLESKLERAEAQVMRLTADRDQAREERNLEAAFRVKAESRVAGLESEVSRLTEALRVAEEDAERLAALFEKPFDCEYSGGQNCIECDSTACDVKDVLAAHQERKEAGNGR